jgi:hypothetical protein
MLNREWLHARCDARDAPPTVRVPHASIARARGPHRTNAFRTHIRIRTIAIDL